MQTCIAIVLEGRRRGQKCQFPPSENSFCNRHQRHYAYSQLVKDNKIPCRFFFRGCNTIVQTQGACEGCKSKMSKKTINCSHDTCKFNTTGDKYCKKHSRDTYRDEEKEKNIKYCDIDRGHNIPRIYSDLISLPTIRICPKPKNSQNQRPRTLRIL